MPDYPLAYAIIFITLIILLLLLGVILTIFIANRQRIQREVAFEKELRTIEQEVQEQLLTNISEELHDNIGQMLTVMHLQLKKGQVKNPDISPLLQPVSDTLNNTINEVRALARGLNSDMVQDNGLLNNIKQDIERLMRLEKFKINSVISTDEILLSKDAQLLVFRMYQEAMNNIMKHAAAKTVTISLTGNPFKLEVADNGKGFNKEELSKKQKGMGLLNLEKRAKMAGLTCDIITSENKGCIFILHQP